MSANEWTSYPFTEWAPFSEFVVDAQLSLFSQDIQGYGLFVTKAVDTGELSIEARDGTAVITLVENEPALVTVYGAYQIWQFTTADISLCLVVRPFTGSWSGVSWEFTQQAVSFSDPNRLLSLSVSNGITETEVSGPGDPVQLLGGSNTTLVPTVSETGISVIINAVFDEDSPCDPEGRRSGDLLASFGGATPNPRGELRLSGGKNMAITKLPSGHPSAPGLQIRNVSFACCDCLDYEEAFEAIAEIHAKLEDYYAEFKEVVLEADEYVLRGQSIINTPVVGDEDE